MEENIMDPQELVPLEAGVPKVPPRHRPCNLANRSCLKGPLRLCRLLALMIFLPSLFIFVPLYLRYKVFSGQMYPMSMTDMRLIDSKISPTWCQRQVVRSNATFNAFVVPGQPKFTEDLVPVSMTRELELQDDMKEYWGFYLLKGSTVTVSACVSYPGASLIMIKGYKHLQECAYIGDDSSEEVDELIEANKRGLLSDSLLKEKLQELKKIDGRANQPDAMKRHKPGVSFHDPSNTGDATSQDGVPTNDVTDHDPTELRAILERLHALRQAAKTESLKYYKPPAHLEAVPGLHRHRDTNVDRDERRWLSFKGIDTNNTDYSNDTNIPRVRPTNIVNKTSNIKVTIDETVKKEGIKVVDVKTNTIDIPINHKKEEAVEQLVNNTEFVKVKDEKGANSERRISSKNMERHLLEDVESNIKYYKLPTNQLVRDTVTDTVIIKDKKGSNLDRKISSEDIKENLLDIEEKNNEEDFVGEITENEQMKNVSTNSGVVNSEVTNKKHPEDPSSKEVFEDVLKRLQALGDKGKKVLFKLHQSMGMPYTERPHHEDALMSIVTGSDEELDRLRRVLVEAIDEARTKDRSRQKRHDARLEAVVKKELMLGQIELTKQFNEDDEPRNHAAEEDLKPDSYADDHKIVNETTAYDMSNSEFWSSFSSSEEALLECAGLILNLPLTPRASCSKEATDDLALTAARANALTYRVPANGYYFFVFNSENEVQTNYIRARFDLQKTRYDVARTKLRECTNSTDRCDLNLDIFSSQKVVLELPLRNNDSLWNEQFVIISECEPRTSIYLVCVIAVPVLILVFAFQ